MSSKFRSSFQPNAKNSPDKRARAIVDKKKLALVKGDMATTQQNPQDIELIFQQLLQKLGVSTAKQSQFQSIFSMSEKIAHIKTCISVLEEDSLFTAADEEMVAVMDVQRKVDSFRLLALKHRIVTATKEWMRAFCESGGISVLLENMDNQLEEYPMRSSNGCALYELLLCMREVMKTDGLQVVIDTRGAVDAFVLSLDFSFKPLALQVLEVLSVTCYLGGDMAVWQVAQGFRHLAKLRDEKPFAVLVSALLEHDVEVQAAVLEFIATLIMSETGLQERMSLRNDLQSLNLQQVCQNLLHSYNNPTVTAAGHSHSHSSHGSSSSHKSHSNQIIVTETFSPAPAALRTLSRQGSRNFLNRSGIFLLGATMAEDGITPIDPPNGVMAGYCMQEEKEYHKDRLALTKWYQLSEGKLSWWLPENKDSDVNAEGSLELHEAVEVLSYSTGVLLQMAHEFNFEIVLINGTRLQFGVSSETARGQWVVALTAGIEYATRQRVAYSFEILPLTEDSRKKAIEKCKKQIALYEAVTQEDHAAIQSGSVTVLDAVELARLINFELISSDRGNQLLLLMRSLATIPVDTEYSENIWQELLHVVGAVEDSSDTWHDAVAHPTTSTGAGGGAMDHLHSHSHHSSIGGGGSGSVSIGDVTPNRLGYRIKLGRHRSPSDVMSERDDGTTTGNRTGTGGGGGLFGSAIHDNMKLRSQMRAEISLIKSQLATSKSELLDMKVENDNLRKKLLQYTDDSHTTHVAKSKWQALRIAKKFVGLGGAAAGITAPPAPPAVPPPNTSAATATSNSTAATTSTTTTAIVGNSNTTGSSGDPANPPVKLSAKEENRLKLLSKLKKKDKGGSVDMNAPIPAITASQLLPPLPPSSNASLLGPSASTSTLDSSDSSTDRSLVEGGASADNPPLLARPLSLQLLSEPSDAKANLLSLLAKRNSDRSLQITPITDLPPVPPSTATSLLPPSKSSLLYTLLPRTTGTTSRSQDMDIKSTANVFRQLRVAVPNPKRNPPPPPPLPGTVPPPLPIHALQQIDAMNGHDDFAAIGLPAKSAVIPKRKMKGVFWTKLKALEVVSTVWEKVEESPLPFDELEEMFGDDVTNQKSSHNGVGGTVPNSTKTGVKSKSVTLFDGKRSQNIHIACGKIRKSPKEIVDIAVKLDPLVLTKDLTETLASIIPTAEEIAVVQGYEGPLSELDLPGRLFLALSEIPRLAQRLKLQWSTHSWPEDADLLAGDIDQLSDAVEEMRSPEAENAMKAVLSLALSAGNYLNGGTPRGQAYGVKLDTLLKLGNIKQSSHSNRPIGNTLLHYLADYLQQTQSEVLVFFDSCVAVWRAAKISFARLESDFLALETDVNSAITERLECEKIVSLEMRRPILDRIDEFVGAGQSRLDELRSSINFVRDGVRSLRTYYGESPMEDQSGAFPGSQSTGHAATNRGNHEEEQCPSLVFFGVITQFAASLKRAMTENAQKKEKCRREELMRANSERRIERTLSNKSLDSLASGAAPGGAEGDLPTVDSTDDVFIKFREAQEESTDILMARFKARMGALRAADLNYSNPLSDDDDSEDYDEDEEDDLNDSTSSIFN